GGIPPGGGEEGVPFAPPRAGALPGGDGSPPPARTAGRSSAVLSGEDDLPFTAESRISPGCGQPPGRREQDRRSGAQGAGTGGSAQAEAGAAGGPLAPPGAGLEHLGALGLLGGRGPRRQTGAADGLPRAPREPGHPVVEPVGADDRRV